MTVDWNGAASGWNRASDTWKNYHSPRARAALAPVGEKLPELKACPGCKYIKCSCGPTIEWLFQDSLMRSRITDSLTNQMMSFQIEPGSPEFFHQHWALEQLMRGRTLSIMSIPGLQVRVRRNYGEQVEVRIGNSEWRPGLHMVQWLLVSPRQLGRYALVGPDQEPAERARQDSSYKLPRFTPPMMPAAASRPIRFTNLQRETNNR